MSASIAGRAVIVTGGTRGIGKGIASVFARNGAKVLVRAGTPTRPGSPPTNSPPRPLPPDIPATSRSCWPTWPAGRTAAGWPRSPRSGWAASTCSARTRDLPRGPPGRPDRRRSDQVFGTNLKGMVLSVQACLPALAASGRGRVILTSSITGPITGFLWTHYGASKDGQLGFMRTAAIELAPKGITVNADLPGNIATEGLANLGEDYASGMTAAIPMRQLGTVDEIGYTALFLATDEAAYITGQTIVVDGGQVLPESPEATAG